MNEVQVKICGVTNVQDARACAELGADMIGLNFYPASPRYIEPKTAQEIVASVSKRISLVGVFVEPTVEQVRHIAQAVGLAAVQLHGDVSPQSCRELARDFRVIRAFSTHHKFRPPDAAQFRHCDVLLDAPHQRLYGGTGTTCDWSAAGATLPFTRFLILSGGLNAENVSEAIAAVQPHAVDICGGVERAPGVKNRAKVEQFIAAVRAACASSFTRSA
jgi:phosphoribosylanthranilate isomerase